LKFKCTTISCVAADAPGLGLDLAEYQCQLRHTHIVQSKRGFLKGESDRPLDIHRKRVVLLEVKQLGAMSAIGTPGHGLRHHRGHLARFERLKVLNRDPCSSA
jgi:hypothetical protein